MGPVSAHADVLIGGPARRTATLNAVVLLLVGGFLGGVLVHLGHRGLDRADRVDMRVSLASQAGTLIDSDGRHAVVDVPVVVENLGPEDLTLQDIRIEGPGATYVGEGPGGPP